jgi:hypothetical protein
LEDIGLLRRKITIEMLHDDVLLEIFFSCINQFHGTDSNVWQTLVHVCQRWRYLIFAFPDHLNVRLRCSKEKPVRETLRIWPALPIAVSGKADNIRDVYDFDDMYGIGDVNNIVVALEQRDRVCEINLECYPNCNTSGAVVSSMLVPFPALKRLFMMTHEVPAPVFPDAFLGGSAPRLQSLHLYGIPFPALQNLLLSAEGLVDLSLRGIFQTGTFLPETIVNYVSHLSRLETLCLEFDSPESCPVPRRRHPPVARVIFPALYRLTFGGVAEYFDDFISRIDAPLICRLDMTFFNQPFVTSDFCQIRQFIGRAEKFKSLTRALINFRFIAVEVSLSQQTQRYNPHLSVGIRSSLATGNDSLENGMYSMRCEQAFSATRNTANTVQRHRDRSSLRTSSPSHQHQHQHQRRQPQHRLHRRSGRGRKSVSSNVPYSRRHGSARTPAS